MWVNNVLIGNLFHLKSRQFFIGVKTQVLEDKFKRWREILEQNGLK